MKTLSRILLASVFFLMSCGSQEEEKVDTTACKGDLTFFQESFEDYSLGPLPQGMPWGYSAYQEVSVIGTGCAVGAQCIKMNAQIPPPGPIFSISQGCYNKGAPFYVQFYMKYSAPPGDYLFTVDAGMLHPNFGVALSNYQDTTPNNPFFDYATTDVWYRVELQVSAQPVKGSFAIYTDDGTVPLDKLTSVDIDNYATDGLSLFSFYVHYGNDSPFSDDYLYIDNFAVSDDPGILMVGF